MLQKRLLNHIPKLLNEHLHCQGKTKTSRKKWIKKKKICEFKDFPPVGAHYHAEWDHKNLLTYFKTAAFGILYGGVKSAYKTSSFLQY